MKLVSYKDLMKEKWFLEAFSKLKQSQGNAKACAKLAEKLNIPSSNRMGFTIACLKHLKDFGKMPTEAEAKGWGLGTPIKQEDLEKALAELATV